ncbi:MAG: RNA-directed DNA polymerase [Chlorobaculum sp.]|nr:RNA-directed DNA polymerase [Chlorobaculum sp.]
MNLKDFKKWFNNAFWKAFKNQAIPVWVPQTKKDRDQIILEVYASIESAQYAPSVPEAEIVMNKGMGVSRIVPVFSIKDYCIYYFCIKELEDILCSKRTENTFGGWTLGGKLRQKENVEIECELSEYGRYSFNPSAWVQAFGEFNSLLYAQINQGNYSHVLQFDLSNFYDCIRLDILERYMREDAPADKGWIIALLFYLLNHWNRRNTGLHPQIVGLPQDALADCSRILANYYLQQYDEFAAKICNKIDALYFRYADDQMILLNDPQKVEILLLLLCRKLDRYGLRVNQKKVMLWKAEELAKHRFIEVQSVFSKKDDTKNPELVSFFVDTYLKIPADELEKSWNQGMPLLNRLIWANLESLSQRKFDLIVSRLLSESYLLLIDHKKLDRVASLNVKQSVPINLDEVLCVLGSKSVHNSFHREVLVFATQTKNVKLELFFKRRLEELNLMMQKNAII